MSNTKCRCGGEKVPGYTWDTFYFNLTDATKFRRSTTHDVLVCTDCHQGENGEPGKPYAELFIAL